MLARNISYRGAAFLLVLVVLILFFEAPVVRALKRLLPKAIRENKKVILVIDLGILILLARWITLLIWNLL